MNADEMRNAAPEQQEFIRSIQKQVLDSYFREYQRLAGIEKEDVEKWIVPVAAARLREWVTDSEKTYCSASWRKEFHTE